MSDRFSQHLIVVVGGWVHGLWVLEIEGIEGFGERIVEFEVVFDVGFGLMVKHKTLVLRFCVLGD